MERYSVTIYIAAPGTPLADESGKIKDTSLPGHMYYAVSDGSKRESFGFAPIEQGSMWGAGEVTGKDLKSYQSPHYQRTIEISKEQHDTLMRFGKNPGEHGFDTYYRDTRNNCVDFVWSALNAAGLSRTLELPGGTRVPLNEFEGKLKPIDNIDPVRTIKPPFPESELNGEKLNPLPKLERDLDGLIRRLFSQEDAERFQRTRELLAQANERQGLGLDAQRLDNIAMDLSLRAGRDPMMGRIDGVVFSQATAEHPAGQFVAAYSQPAGPQGPVFDVRAPTQQAAQTPALDALTAAQSQAAQEPARSLAQDAPVQAAPARSV